MENSILVGLSRQSALRRQLEVVAANLANMNTTGYKGTRMLFTDHLVRASGIADPAQGNQITFARDVATIQNLTQGSLQMTENPLDVAIDGEGYFTVEGPDGPLYTRNGRFDLDEAGLLVTDQGYPVLADNGGPITVPADAETIEVAADGTMSSGDTELGKLQIVRFANPQEMQAVGGGMLQTDAVPQAEGAGRAVQHALEASNVEPILEMQRMIEIHRSYTSINKMIQTEDSRIKKMIEAYSA